MNSKLKIIVELNNFNLKKKIIIIFNGDPCINDSMKLKKMVVVIGLCYFYMIVLLITVTKPVQKIFRCRKRNRPAIVNIESTDRG